MMEHEKKLLLTEELHDFLIQEVYPTWEMVTQINHYYDTEDQQLRMQNVTCRIREKGRRFVATVKRHGVAGDPDASWENHFETDGVPPVLVYGDQELVLWGSLKTERKRIQTGELLVCIDRNTYLGSVDYELELEYPEEGEANALQELERIGELCALCGRKDWVKAMRSQIKSKSERFFHALPSLESSTVISRET